MQDEFTSWLLSCFQRNKTSKYWAEWRNNNEVVWQPDAHGVVLQGDEEWADDACWLCFLFVLAEIREAFKVLDRDGNGFISKQELGMAMRSLGYMPSEVELAIIMQRLDMDGESF